MEADERLTFAPSPAGHTATHPGPQGSDTDLATVARPADHAGRPCPTERPGPNSVGLGVPHDRRSNAARARRNELVEANIGLVEHFVRRYSHRGVLRDDLRQTASLALVQAADRFDADVGVAFATFAGVTIDGTLKRHFRDRTWAIRPPRRVQELHLEVRKADDELSQRLGRHPTVAEIAREIDADIDHVLEAMDASSAHGTLSIDASPASDDHGGGEPGFLGTDEPGYLGAEAKIVLDGLLAELDERRREVLRLRFVDGLTQQEIADRLGLSQSYLSRMIREALVSMRQRLGDVRR
jgi:RNA polymerase sigma-B factor